MWVRLAGVERETVGRACSVAACAGHAALRHHVLSYGNQSRTLSRWIFSSASNTSFSLMYGCCWRTARMAAGGHHRNAGS